VWRDNLRGILCIIIKDMKAYYLKPPAMSWGVLLPGALVLAFYLRDRGGVEEMVPGLIALTVLFSTTAMEAVVINFELRIGAMERLLLAPISLWAVLMGKVLGGAVFGLIVVSAVGIGCIIGLGLFHSSLPYLIPVILLSLVVFSALGALVSVSVKEVFEAQTLANFARFPMIFLCGVFTPVGDMPAVLRHIAYALPLTYTVDGAKYALAAEGGGSPARDIVILAAFALALMLPAVRMLQRRFE
jgi:ABC-2 type transport system permease protein